VTNAGEPIARQTDTANQRQKARGVRAAKNGPTSEGIEPFSRWGQGRIFLGAAKAQQCSTTLRTIPLVSLEFLLTLSGQLFLGSVF
jgi:hypothetical protein